MLTYAFEGGGRTKFRLVYYDENEQNRIDVLPVNFRSAVATGENPSGVGVPDQRRVPARARLRSVGAKRDPSR